MVETKSMENVLVAYNVKSQTTLSPPTISPGGEDEQCIRELSLYVAQIETKLCIHVRLHDIYGYVPIYMECLLFFCDEDKYIKVVCIYA